MEAVRNNEAAVVVHERHQVDAPVLALEDEGKEVGLPQLVGPGPFEAADLVGMGAGRFVDRFVARVMQDPRHGRWAGRQRRPPRQHVADPLAPPFGMSLFEHQDGPLRHLGESASLLGAPWLIG